MRFNDKAYLDEFYKSGSFPKIHDDIFALDRFVSGESVIDLGCCTGLLARRLVETHSIVIGIESEKRYLDMAVQHERIVYVNMKVSLATIERLKEIIRCYRVSAVFARRVIPELYETGGWELVSGAVRAFYESGVDVVVLEGRKPTSRAVNPLSSIDDEVDAFSEFYSRIITEKNCAVLRRKGK